MWGLLFYDPVGGINCQNVVPMEENWAGLLSTLPKRCLFNSSGGKDTTGSALGEVLTPILHTLISSQEMTGSTFDAELDP